MIKLEFGNELGKTLDGVLRDFLERNLSVADLIMKYQIEGELITETMFALYQRGYIAEVQENKQYDCYKKIYLDDEFRLTVEGRDYIELHDEYKTRFWLRFVVCPAVVSFITALNADKVWNVIIKVGTILWQLTQGTP